MAASTLDAPHRLQRDFGREIRRAAQLQKCVVLPQRAVFRHVAAGLPHEPDGGAVNRLTPACAQKSASAAFVTGGRDHACYIIEFVLTPEV